MCPGGGGGARKRTGGVLCRLLMAAVCNACVLELALALNLSRASCA